MLALSILPVAGIRMRAKPSAVRQIFNFAPWKELPYLLFGIALFVDYVDMYIPLFYIQIYSLENNNRDYEHIPLANCQCGWLLRATCEFHAIEKVE